MIYGVRWYVKVWYDVTLYGLVCNSMIWYGPLGTIWYGVVLYSGVCYGPVWYDRVFYGVVGFGILWFALQYSV